MARLLVHLLGQHLSLLFVKLVSSRQESKFAGQSDLPDQKLAALNNQLKYIEYFLIPNMAHPLLAG